MFMIQNMSLLLAVKPDAAAPAPVHSGIPVWIFIVCIVLIAAAAYFVANYLAKSMNEKLCMSSSRMRRTLFL